RRRRSWARALPTRSSSPATWTPRTRPAWSSTSRPASARARRTSDGARHALPHDVARVTVVPQPQIDRRAHGSGARPLRELHLADELGLDEHRVLHARRGRERARVPAQRVEQLDQPPQLGLGEAGPDASGVLQPRVGPGGLVVADQEGPQARAAGPLPGGPPADHELLAVVVLHLQPRA